MEANVTPFLWVRSLFSLCLLFSLVLSLSCVFDVRGGTDGGEIFKFVHLRDTWGEEMLH